ncbi:MAG TPA: type I-U CRISPR-associated helicase/endonuclease Cas3, partial [Thermoleophilia bacterium]|nr:type I-U CRISPR-associated helicase/endonuclease Cas3 [Thermoleophilia bacterium]
MTPLHADDFAAFFTAVHGYEPFPWQERLARQVVQTGHWPPSLDLPTASGKTAAIDIAVFHLACEAERGPERKAPMRILFVIDRRIVVDEAFRRARRVADALRGLADGVLLKVKERLAQLSGDPSRPLDVVRLRGGVPQERDWARSPAQPLVAVSTVDQVGSRLLFRGYGVSPRMSPVHAGLVGADALWLLDEVHLSRPLAETLGAIASGHPAEGDGMLADRPRLAPFEVVYLSATPGEDMADAFRLSEADWAHDKLSPRLTASKIATLVPVSEDLADAFVEHALRLAGLAQEPPTPGKTKRGKRKRRSRSADQPLHPVHRLAVVVNRVNLARQVFERLRQRIQKNHAGQADVVLLTGRVRPLDRDRLLGKLQPLFASPERAVPEKPIILVSTQTIEVGADLDVDALVTEIAPVDSLRQRFGRLDRLGLRKKSSAVILAPARNSDWDAPEWRVLESIYGGSARAAADWIRKLGGEVDFGIEALSALEDEIAEDLLAPRAQAPVLLPPYADLWATTSPAPAATPEPALFLHGPGISADVQAVWRADVSPEDTQWANVSLSICPPSSLEAMTVPVWAVRRWLQREDVPFADVPQREPGENGGLAGRAYLRREGGRWLEGHAEHLRPGDTVVVPCSYGGCDEYGWNPQY